VLLGVLALTALLASGCQGREPRFDLIPGPVSIRSLWTAAPDPKVWRAADWECIDAAHREYLRAYSALVARDGTALVRGFKSTRGEEWRNDETAIEQWIARHASLMSALATLDSGFIGGLSECGITEAWIARLQTDREIDRCRVVIEGHGPAIVDLRRFVDRDHHSDARVQAVLGAYAVSLAPRLASLQDAERSRPLRLRRAFLRLESESAAGAGDASKSPRTSDEIKIAAEGEAAQPVRRALARVLDLNLSTLEQLLPLLPEQARDALRQRMDSAVDMGLGGAGGDPSFEWQVEVIAHAQSIDSAARAAVNDRLATFRERDRALRDELVSALRRPESAMPLDPLRRRREELRKEVLSQALNALPDADRAILLSLRGASPEDFESKIRQVASSAADWLLSRCPPSFRPQAPESPSLLPDLDSATALFMPAPADERWLARLLDRCSITGDAALVAQQLWRDHAAAALVELEAPHRRTRERESEIGQALRDQEQLAGAIDRWFTAIAEEMRIVEAIETRFLDALDPLLEGVDDRARARIRLERALERECIQWRQMPFSELLGFGSIAFVSAPEVLSSVDLDAGERAIAEEVLIDSLPVLVSEASGFRREGLAMVRRMALAISSLRDDGVDGERAFRATLASAAATVRPSVERHIALHRGVVDQVAELLPARRLELSRRWRRTAYPELFIDDHSVEPIVDLAERVVEDDVQARAAVAAAIARWHAARDADEQLMMIERRAAIVDQPLRARDDIRNVLRAWPSLATAIAVGRETHARLLRDIALAVHDPRVTTAVNDWMRPAPSDAYWIAE